MRVIAGTARRIPLKTLPGNDTRPTTDRIKETLFNIIQNEIYGSRFLDLFAGSGQIGIEALSRGASYAAFVDHNKHAAECIRSNLEKTKLESRGGVYMMDVAGALKRLSYEEPFDIIFMDPPYKEHLEREVFGALADSPLITEQTLIILEAEKGTDLSYVEEMGFHVGRQKEYKTNMHVFLSVLPKEREGV